MRARLAAGLLAGLLTAAAAASGALGPLERGSVDARYGVRGPAPAPGVAVVAIDERSIAALGAWPWRRTLHARAVDILRRDGVRAIVYDVQFTEPTHARARTARCTSRSAARAARCWSRARADGHGHTNVLGGDAKLRRVHAARGRRRTDQRPRTARSPASRARSAASTSVAAVVCRALAGRPLPAAHSTRRAAWIDFRGGPGTIPHGPVLRRACAGGSTPPRVRGKIVVVGVSTPTLQDVHPTPIGGERLMSGPEVQAERDLDRAARQPAAQRAGAGSTSLARRAARAGRAAAAAAARRSSRRPPPPGRGRGLGRGGAARVRPRPVVAVVAPLLALALGTVGTRVAASWLERRRRRVAASPRRSSRPARAHRELRDTQLEIIQRLGAAVESRDQETGRPHLSA